MNSTGCALVVVSVVIFWTALFVLIVGPMIMDTVERLGAIT